MAKIMRNFKLFIHSLLLATTPSLLVYPQEGLPHIAIQTVTNEDKEPQLNRSFSYDDVIELLDQIESGELEKTASAEDLEKINQFLTFLAQEGVLPDDSYDYLALEKDVTELLHGTGSLYEFAFSLGAENEDLVIPAIFNHSGEVIFCKGWFHKRWDHTKKFIKKHKKEIIIGAVIAVAVVATVVAVVAASSTAATVAGTAGGAAASYDKSPPSHKADSPSISLNPMSSSSTFAAMADTPMLTGIMEEQIFSFKETLVKEQFFQTSNSLNSFSSLSLEETGRVLGSLLAHENAQHVNQLIPQYPKLSYEIQTLSTQLTYPISKEQNHSSPHASHFEIDRQFSTDYAPLFVSSEKQINLSGLSHEALGERALTSGYHNQAIHHFGKAIEINPTNPIPYLQRGIAHFELGQYDHSLEAFQQFTTQSPIQTSHPLSVVEFSQGFAKGLMKGVYESGEGFILFMADFVKHPVQTSKQMVESISTLVDLVRSDKWGIVAEVLSPEIHQLVTQWDMLSSENKGKLAGHAIGKHGADILTPGAVAKVASKCAKTAQELATIYKNFQIAQETLLLETAAGIGNGAKVAEVVRNGQTMMALGEEMGFTTHEIAKLKQAGKLEASINHSFEEMIKNPITRESFELFNKAEAFLEPYCKGFLPEAQVRELIHQTGIKTFSRPTGIPENFLVKITDKGVGMEYVHPTNPHIRVRIMPGKPHSPNPNQQKPYVIYKKHGQIFDKSGNVVKASSQEAHIPLDEFSYPKD